MSRECYHIAFKIRAVVVAESQSYPFPSVASGCFNYKCNAHTKSASKKETLGLVFKDLRSHYLVKGVHCDWSICYAVSHEEL